MGLINLSSALADSDPRSCLGPVTWNASILKRVFKKEEKKSWEKAHGEKPV